MTTAIARRDPRDMTIGGFTMTSTGLIVSGQPTFDEWQLAGQYLERVGSGVQWWIGDWLNYADGRPQWGDKYEQAISLFNVPYDTLAQWKRVAASIEFCNRLQNLSWTHHLAVASCDPSDIPALLDLVTPLAPDKPPKLTVAELKKEVRRRKLAAERAKNPLPLNKFRVLYADPPCEYGDELIEGYGAAEHHYPTLSISELCELHDATGRVIKDCVLDDAVLFLWTTSPMLEDAFQVITAWGFQYKTNFVWDKVKHNYGHYNSVRHEHLLVATRGACVPDSKTLQDSVVECDRDEVHSRKPDVFYGVIERMYLDGPRLELFARQQREGWTAWGNEATKMKNIANTTASN